MGHEKAISIIYKVFPWKLAIKDVKMILQYFMQLIQWYMTFANHNQV